MQGTTPGKNNQKYNYKMSDTWLEGSTTKKDLGVLVDHRPNTSLQWDVAAQKANAVFEYINRSIKCKMSEVASLIKSTVSSIGLHVLKRLWRSWRGSRVT